MTWQDAVDEGPFCGHKGRQCLMGTYDECLKAGRCLGIRDKVIIHEYFPKGTCPPDQHVWPDQPKDQDQCPKCGMQFLTHITMEMP